MSSYKCNCVQFDCIFFNVNRCSFYLRRRISQWTSNYFHLLLRAIHNKNHKIVQKSINRRKQIHQFRHSHPIQSDQKERLVILLVPFWPLFLSPLSSTQTHFWLDVWLVFACFVHTHTSTLVSFWHIVLGVLNDKRHNNIHIIRNEI